MSYTRDRDARRRRIKARGEKLDEPRKTLPGVKCSTCADTRKVVKQGRGLVPCPSCSGAA